MIRQMLNLVSWNNRKPQSAAAITTVVETLEGRLFMSVAPSAVAVPASTIAADRAAIRAELKQIKADARAAKAEIASAREHFLTVTSAADQAAIDAAKAQYKMDYEAGPGIDIDKVSFNPTPPILLDQRSILAADKAAIVTAKARLKTDRGVLFSMIKLDIADGRTKHLTDESALHALEVKLKAESR